MKKVFSVLLSLVLLISVLSVGVVSVSAASTPDSQVLNAYAGETIKIKFVEDNCYGVSGNIEYSNRNLFSSLTPNTSSYGPITESSFILSSYSKVKCEVILTVKISDSAKVGDSCVVSFTDCELVENNEDYTGRSGYTKSVTVKVIKKPTTTKKTTTTKKPTTTTTKKPATTTKKPATTSKKPATTTNNQNSATTTTKAPVANLDLVELNKQIGIAQSLDESEYTADSWKQMESALKAAIKARNANTQNEVNKAADALSKAIAALKKLDGSDLEQLVATVKDYLKENDLTTVWDDLYDALTEADAALKSGDQDAIDAAYTRLDAAFKALKDKLEEIGKGDVVVQEVEVQGECDKLCHAWWHYLLMILLFISVILNVVLFVLVVLSFIRRKKKKIATDNVPVVDYDINDDQF